MAHFRTDEGMYSLIEVWQTQKVFYIAHNISVSVFTYWLFR